MAESSIEDRLAIRELLETYADALFRRDEASWSACWAEDAVWIMAGETRGRDAIIAAWRRAIAPFSLIAFYVFPGTIVVEENSAQARSYTREHLFMINGGVRRMIGRYDDEVVRTNRGWRFAARRYTLLREDAEGAVGGFEASAM